MDHEIFNTNAANRLRTFISEAMTSIFFVDVRTKKFRYANSAMCTLTGFSFDELMTMSLYQLTESPVWEVDGRIEQLLNERKLESRERKWKAKDGHTIHVLVNCFCPNGESEMIFCCAQDITERKKAEEELQSNTREMETFICRASHDIRGPLASIIGLVNVSRLELTDEKSLQYLGMIESAALKLDYTLSELVTAMKLKNAKQFTDEIDFGAMIQEVLTKFSHYQGFSRLRTEVRIAVRRRHLSNRVVLETVLQNLIENSIKYQRAEISDPFVKIDVEDNDEGIFISIEDNGIGIDQAVQSQVYEMYFRGTTSAKGSGLGLYLVKKAIEKLNGHIELSSASGNGTTFRIHLPAADAAA